MDKKIKKALLKAGIMQTELGLNNLFVSCETLCEKKHLDDLYKSLKRLKVLLEVEE